jgi:DegV family protein with EDD domain
VTAEAANAARSRISYLDGRRLNRSLRAGVRRVLAQQEQLNKINVFPVPDGDTGTNLALTLAAVGTALSERPSRHAGTLLIAVADAALDGARGNSGAILAQFLQGLADELGTRDRIHAPGLAAGLAAASRYARDAMAAPLDGTILTVADEVAAAATEISAAGVTDLAEMLDGLLVRARQALESTRSGLEAMRRAGVVDAGAQGFVLLLEGIDEFVSGGSLRDEVELPASVLDMAAVAARGDPGDSDAPRFRFCTECMLTGDGIDRHRVRETLSSLGDSMVLAGTRSKLKIHIHTDHPDQVFEAAREHGTVSATKADDMHQQTRTLGRQGARAAVVTDSAADLPDWAYEDLAIHFVPLRINFGTRSYMDKVTLSAPEFFTELRAGRDHPTTSQPAPGDFRRVYEFLASHFEQVVSISLSRNFSGSWQAAASAAGRVRGGTPVTVIDSRTVSVGQGLIAMYAAECARAGWHGEMLTGAIESAVLRTQSYGLVTDLSFAVRGGRVGRGRKWVADRLGLVPIFGLSPEGRLVTRRLVFRRQDTAGALARYALSRMDGQRRWRVAVGHADRPAEAQRLKSLLEAGVPHLESCFVAEIGATLGAHGGPGTLVIAAQHYVPPGETSTGAISSAP